MITITHNDTKVLSVYHSVQGVLPFEKTKNIAQIVLAIAKIFPNENIVWCHFDVIANLDNPIIEKLLIGTNIILSFDHNNFLPAAIGYIEESPFINVNKSVKFPTWQMSSTAGIMHSSVLNKFKNHVKADRDFTYFLMSIAKIGMPNGLLCFSEPRIFKNFIQIDSNKVANSYTLFRFVKQHFRSRWVFILFFDLFIYEKKKPLMPLLLSLLFKNRMKTEINFDELFSLRKAINSAISYDVVIPTIGRKEYLFSFLNDLNQQTVLPKNVIIIEQNPKKDSVSDLDFLQTAEWLFPIKHLFTHQTGACNARNLGILETNSYWTFLADDDISIKTNFSQLVLSQLNNYEDSAATINCHLKNEKQVFNHLHQWNTFGSGSSFVKTSDIKKCRFDKGFEHGFGEDADFGMQLRNNGIDILYFPSPKVLHHKAPLGGFRTKPILAWQSQKVAPKPSPTVMLYQMKHSTAEQILGYKTILFIKFYRKQSVKNPIIYFRNMNQQWEQSVFWANKLMQIK